MSTLPVRATDTWAVARRTAALVNLIAGGAPASADIVATLAEWGDELDQPPTAADRRELATVVARLRTVFDVDDVDGAAARLNDLLAAWCHPPRLVRHEGWPWHLHVDADDDGPLALWAGASAAYALAVLLAGRAAPPWGVCAATGCDRVFVHDERGGPRRYCSTACGTRDRVARHRRRQA